MVRKLTVGIVLGDYKFLYSFKKFSSSVLKSSLSSSEYSPKFSNSILSDSSVDGVDVGLEMVNRSLAQ